jgi:hypothetical protein
MDLWIVAEHEGSEHLTPSPDLSRMEVGSHKRSENVLELCSVPTNTMGRLCLGGRPFTRGVFPLFLGAVQDEKEEL